MADTNTKSCKVSEPPIRKVNRQIPRSGDLRPCRSCGRKNHSREDCRFRDANCYSCGKRGHIAPACKSAPFIKSRKTAKTFRLDDGKRSPSYEDSSSDEYELHRVGKCSTEPVQVKMVISGKRLDMEFDTDAALSLSHIGIEKKNRFP